MWPLVVVVFGGMFLYWGVLAYSFAVAVIATIVGLCVVLIVKVAYVKTTTPEQRELSKLKKLREDAIIQRAINKEFAGKASPDLDAIIDEISKGGKFKDGSEINIENCKKYWIISDKQQEQIELAISLHNYNV